jgi:hypothetical protein
MCNIVGNAYRTSSYGRLLQNATISHMQSNNCKALYKKGLKRYLNNW